MTATAHYDIRSWHDDTPYHFATPPSTKTPQNSFQIQVLVLAANELSGDTRSSIRNRFLETIEGSDIVGNDTQAVGDCVQLQPSQGLFVEPGYQTAALHPGIELLQLLRLPPWSHEHEAELGNGLPCDEFGVGMDPTGGNGWCRTGGGKEGEGEDGDDG
ncbi:hypothetical protein B0O99DRAFT_277667 [Bisporella sp. PMI_857]|nr:hypothetical protein B0O99DRAFT_277667 [Bisporella sp. PMI_857]